MSIPKKSFGLRSLQTRITVFIAAIATLVLAVSGTYDYVTVREAKLVELHDFTQRLAERTGSILERPLWNVDRPAVASIVQTEMKDKRIYAMIVVEDDNQRVFFGRLSDGTSLDSLPELPDSMLFIKEPIIVGDLYIGAVMMYVTPEFLQRELQERVMSSVLRSLTLVSVLAMLMMFVVRRIVLRPLSRLSKAMEHIVDAEDYSVRTEKELDDEFGGLAESFNTMLEVIESRESMLNNKSKLLESLVRERTEELDSARVKAEEASRAKSEFVANMSHELRTPMNAIIGMIDIIRKTELTDKQLEYARIIKTSAKTLLGIVNDILDFSKIEAQKLELEKIPFSLHDTLEEVADMFSERLVDSGVEFVVDVSEGVPDGCSGDPLRLSQVLINLINNAFKFTEQGEICLYVEPVEITDSQYEIRFSVRDTGVGIEESARATLFDMFTQADGSTTRRYGGTGLGLAISKELVVLMGGAIGVESVLGEGSTFIFTVVFPPASIESSVALSNEIEALHGKCALIVEDNATNALVMEKILRGFGIASDAVPNGEEALGLLQEQLEKYDFILLDWRLPGMNGIEVLTTLGLRQVALPPVVMMTAFGSEVESLQAEKLGISYFLMKPVKTASMRKALLSVFDLAVDGNDDIEVVDSVELTGSRVLLVEDNMINQQVAREILESEGLVVEAAENGEEALETLNRRSFDVVLMDIQMPGMDGFETTRRVRQRPDWQEIPVIAMTAHVMSEDKEEAMNSGMNDYLTKPIDRQLLFSVLRKWIGKPAGAVKPKLPSSLFSNDTDDGVSLSDEIGSSAPLQRGAGKKGSVNKPGYDVSLQIFENSGNGTEELSPPASLFGGLPVGVDSVSVSGGNPETAPADSGEELMNTAEVTNDGLPESLPGLDVSEGLGRISGKLWLYRSILDGFLSNYRESANEISKLVKEGKAEEAERLAHTVAGAAGNVSASLVRKACLDIENSLRKKKPGVENSLAELTEQMEIACVSMETLLPRLPADK